MHGSIGERTRPTFDACQVDPRIRLAMRILENDQQVVPSVATVAERVGLSPAHFSRSFASQVGEASAAYGRRIRLDHAINRLRYDPGSIGEVAQDFGYESQAAFTRAFAEQFGASPREYMALARQQLEPSLPLPGAVRLVQRPPTPLAARRFFGNDHARWWRIFTDGLPDDLRDGAAFIGLTYDDPRVTPERHQRLDCCVALRPGGWQPGYAQLGLDPIELPGGLHAEVEAQGPAGELPNHFAGLFGEWLPTRPSLAPEGDPLPVFFGGPPTADPAVGRVAIRVRHRPAEPQYNARCSSAAGALTPMINNEN